MDELGKVKCELQNYPKVIGAEDCLAFLDGQVLDLETSTIFEGTRKEEQEEEDNKMKGKKK